MILLFIVGANRANATAAPQMLTCDTPQQIIQGNGFDLGFSCTVTVQGVIVPAPRFGEPQNFDLYTWNYSLTLLSEQIQGLTLSGTFPTDDVHDLGTWTLSNVGDVANFSASGYIEDMNAFTIKGSNGNVMTVYAPGPVPESSSLVLGLLGLATVGVFVVKRVSL